MGVCGGGWRGSGRENGEGREGGGWEGDRRNNRDSALLPVHWTAVAKRPLVTV